MFDVLFFWNLKWLYLTTDAIVESVELPYDIIPEHWYKNSLIDYVYEKELYDLLPNTQGVEEEEKGRALYYTQGETGIYGLTHVADQPGFWNPSQQTIRELLEKFSGTHLSIEERLQAFIKPEFLAEATALFDSMGYYQTDDPQSVGGQFAGKMGFQVVNLNTGTVKDMRFRVKYQPLYNVNLFTYRERDLEEEVITFQYHNQQSSVIDSRVLGEIHDKIIERGSGIGKTLNFLHKDHSTIIPLGARYDRYIFTSADYMFSKYGVKVVYNLDQYFTKLQKHIAVLEEFRQFAIPRENIVLRQYTNIIKAKFEDEPKSQIGAPLLNVSDFIGVREDVEIDYFHLGLPLGIVLPVARFPFNNSLVFQAETLGNVNAGFKSVDFDGTKRNNKVVSYTNDEGRITSSSSSVFGRGLEELTLEQSHSLPEYSEQLNKEVFLCDFNLLDKDAREKLGFITQIHHTDGVGNVYINK